MSRMDKFWSVNGFAAFLKNSFPENILLNKNKKLTKPCPEEAPLRSLWNNFILRNLCNFHTKRWLHLVTIVNDNISDTKTIHGPRKTLQIPQKKMNPFQVCPRKIVKTHARKNVRRVVFDACAIAEFHRIWGNLVSIPAFSIRSNLDAAEVSFMNQDHSLPVPGVPGACWFGVLIFWILFVARVSSFSLQLGLHRRFWTRKSSKLDTSHLSVVYIHTYICTGNILPLRFQCMNSTDPGHMPVPQAFPPMLWSEPATTRSHKGMGINWRKTPP